MPGENKGDDTSLSKSEPGKQTSESILPKIGMNPILTPDFESLPIATTDRTQELGVNPVFRSPNIEKWVDSLEMPTDYDKKVASVEYWNKYIYGFKGPSEAESERIAKARERVFNEHLKERLPVQIVDILLNPSILITVPRKDNHGNYPRMNVPKETFDKMVEAVREGNFSAIYRGLEARRFFVNQDCREREEASRLKGEPPEHLHNERRKYENELWGIEQTLDALKLKRLVPTFGSDPVHPHEDIPNWEEILGPTQTTSTSESIGPKT